MCIRDRQQHLPGPEAASDHSTCDTGRPEDTDIGRGDQQRRHQNGDIDTEGHGQFDGGQDQLRDSTQAFHHQGCRHNPGDEGRRHSGTGNPRRAVGKGRILRQPLQQPVREERIGNHVKLTKDRFILNRSLSFQNLFVANPTIVSKSNMSPWEYPTP